MAKTFKRAIAVLLSVLMIATTLPFTAITASAADKITYEFDVFSDTINGNGDRYLGGVNENGHTYDTWGNLGYVVAGSGLANFSGGCLFVNDETARNYVRSGAFSVEITAKVTSADTKSLLALANNPNDIVRFDTDGKLYVNNDEYVGETAIDTSIMTDYAISYDGTTLKLFVNGVEKISKAVTLNLQGNIAYTSIGFTDHTAGRGKIDASVDMLAISNGAFDPAEYLANNKARATADNNVKTGTATGRFYNHETPNYYSNLLFCSNDVVWSGNGSSDTVVSLSNINYKICFPSSVVMMYDGKTAPSFPAKMECKSTDTGKTRCYVYIDSAKDYLTFKKNWIMNTRAWDDWDLSVTEDTTGYSSENRLRSNENQAANKNTSRFWYNNAYYNVDLNDNTPYVNFTEVAFTCHLNSNWDATYVDTHNTVNNNRGQFYVINYKPIADIYAAVKAKVAEVARDEANYTNAAGFYSVAADVLTLDPNASCYDYANHANFAVPNVASSIQNAVDAYNAYTLECAHINTTVKDAKTPDFKNAGYTGDTYCDFCETKIATGESIELTTPDMEVYDDVLAAVDVLVESDYTSESWSALQQAITDAATKVDDALVQKDIDDAAAMVQTAINNLKTKGYTVTVNVQKNGEKYCEPIVASVNAGGLYTYSAPAGEQIYKAVYDGQKLVNGSNSFDVVVTKDMEIFVYLTDEVVADTKVKATFKAANGKVVAVQYYENNTAINVNDVAAPVIPFYNFDQWARVSDSEKNIVFEATYTPAMVDDEIAEKCTIHAIDMTIKNGLTDYDAFYDEIIGFNAGGNKIAMYADADRTELLAYVDSDYYMHAPRRAEVWIAPASASEYVGITGSYAYIDEAGLTTAVFNANKIGTGVEYGVVATLSSTVAYEMSTYKFEAGEKFVVTAPTTKVSSIGEFTVAIHSDFGDRTVVYAKPYVKHSNGTYTYGNVVELDITQLA